MDKNVLRNFGDKPDYLKKAVIIICLLVFLFSSAYILMNFDFSIFEHREERILDSYAKNTNFTVAPIGDSKANKYTFRGVDCWLEYSVYSFKNEMDALESFGHRDLLGRGFLEGRQYEILAWANKSRVDYYFMKYDDFLSKTNMVRRIVFLFENEIYDLETNCNEDLSKLSYELANN